MCGLVGIYNWRSSIPSETTAQMVYYLLHAQQHRAQDYCGITTSDGAEELFHRRGKGIVQNAFKKRHLRRLHGQHGIGHIRYPTTNDNPELDNTQPILGVCNNYRVAMAHNGNLRNANQLQRQLEELDPSLAPIRTSMDSEVALRLFCHSQARKLHLRVFDAVRQLRGSYVLLFQFGDTMVAVRDPYGNRPLSIGRKNGSLFFSSETVSFTDLRIDVERGLRPGEIFIVTPEGEKSWYFTNDEIREEQFDHPKAHCVFELIYLGHPASELYGISIAKWRMRAGMELAKACPVPNGDLVIPIPDSANFYAIGYGKQAKIEYLPAILRSHYIGRSFIMPDDESRIAEIVKKFSVVPSLVRGKKIILLDDSIVRLNTMPKVIDQLLYLGAAEVHVRIACPPIVEVCELGIDMPTKQELVASYASIEEIRDRSQAASLKYLPMESLATLVEQPDNYCFACMQKGGRCPIPAE